MTFEIEKLQKEVLAAENFIKRKVSHIPEIVVVLGSGLAYFGDKIEAETVIDTADIPNYPQPTVSGHQGKIIFGKVGQANIIAVKGRSHYYEGKSFEEITFYVQLFQKLGVKKLVLTNAAGGVNPQFMPGDFVLINGFINFGQVDVVPNVDIDKLLSPDLQAKALKAAEQLNIPLQQGVYCWTTGPSFETPAEVQIIHSLGGDLAGMSTLPEAIIGKELGFDILGISLVTNQAAGIGANPLTHEEVRETADKIKGPYYHFMKNVINTIN